VSESTPVGSELDGDGNPLADAGQRLRWADADGEAFSDLSKWFKETDAYSVRVQRDGNRWEASWHRSIDPEVEAENFIELARLLGSFLDHTRAALNYATYQLALLAIRREPSLEGDLIPESVDFPIFTNPKLFKRQNRVKKLPQEYRDAIEAVQPYDGQYPGLWVLHELAREYRHRVVHPTAIIPAQSVYHVLVNGLPTWPPDLEIIPHERLEHGDVVMRFSVEIPGNPNPGVHPQVAIAVGIDHPLTRGLIGTSVLNQIGKDAGAALDIIEALLEAPEEVHPDQLSLGG
jgi:hypothetical protein